MNYKITISYCGTNFFGFAKQNNLRTIEQTIIDTFSLLFGIKVKVFGSGRTDRYVHAYKQVISINHDNLNLLPIELLHALNSKLPNDIMVIDCCVVDNKFHARFNTKNKTYIYKINTNSKYDIFQQNLIYQYNKSIDLAKLDEYCKKIIGTHNFLSFSTTEVEDTTRTVYTFDYEFNNGLLVLKINGNGFLRNMVRMIVGCFLNYNENKITINDIDDYFNNPQKGKVVRKEKGCGLYLYEVNY